MSQRRKKNLTIVRIPEILRVQMLEDLRRPHPYAAERVGFLYTRSQKLKANVVLVIATEYSPVRDLDYIKDPSVGAKIGSTAIRGAMQQMLERQEGCFHVHLHGHRGRPSPSPTDQQSLPGVADSLANVSAEQVTGFLILSQDDFYCQLRLPGRSRLSSPEQITGVGFPMKFHFDSVRRAPESAVFHRQSFLGQHAQTLFENIQIGIVGYGGGGSHIGQQFAHIGIKQPVVFDDDHIEASNLNRLVGGTWKDVLRKALKTSIARRIYKAIFPGAKIVTVNCRWQDAPSILHGCDIVVGCADTYAERQQLEAECRRYLIPYIDIGMDIHKSGDDISMSGQIMLSMPGGPCFWCYGFLTEEKLGREAAKYGDIGGRPQVVWPNGVLASTAVGVIVELITGWTGRKNEGIYLEYDGNTGKIADHIRTQFCDKVCSHYPIEICGPVHLKSL